MMHLKPAHWIPSAIAAGAVLLTGNAQAAQIYATEVVYYDINGTNVAESRQDLTNALGAPQLDSKNLDFLSLGMGGRAVFDFGQAFSGDVSLWETTWGNKSSQGAYDEQVDIYYGNFATESVWQELAHDLSQWVYAGEILNIADGAYNTEDGATNAGSAPEGIFSHVLLVDKSEVKGNRDGFDVNAIAVNGVDPQAVPEPASALALVMVGAVGGTRLLKRRAA
ncbi:MAG: PEP-CTERM sorting domain-containing protein [Leptolyngbyaceae cyanobacterium]